MKTDWTSVFYLFAVQCLTCFVLYTAAVAFGVYGFTGYISGFYLFHFGNAIAIMFMRKKSWFRKIILTVFCFWAYALVRLFNQTWTHVAIAGGMNILEQLTFSYILDRLCRTVMIDDAHFPSWLLCLSLLGSALFALMGAAGLAASTDSPFPHVLLLYFFSHISGNYIGLQVLYVLCDVLPKPPRLGPAVELLLFTSALIPLNMFRNYRIFRNATIIITFPLVALISTRHSLQFCIASQFIFMFITYSSIYFDRGPYIVGNKLETVVSTYVVSIISLYMSCLLNILIRQKATALAHITSLHDDIYFTSCQMSHDMKLPVSHIMSISDMIQRSEYTSTDVEELTLACESVKEQAESWLMMLNPKAHAAVQTRTVYTDEVFKKLNFFAKRTIQLSNKPITYHPNISDEIPEKLELNSSVLYHVVSNLISNAVKYSEDGELRMNVLHDPDSNMLQVSISDQGHGIPLKDQNRIFQRFIRIGKANSTGSHGIGLYIVKTLMTKSGGHVALQSEPGVGSVFTIKLPAKAVGDSMFTFNLKALKILLVEDNRLAAILFAKMLFPATVTTLADGAAVFPMLQTQQFDVILLDGQLPHVSGEEVMQHILATPSLNHMSIIYIGGSEIDTNNSSIVQCQKPFTKIDLHIALHDALKRKL